MKEARSGVSICARWGGIVVVEKEGQVARQAGRGEQVKP